jgi:ribonuclease D
MADYRLIENNKDLQLYLDNLNENQTQRIAVDMEGDQGSFRYHYSISLIQCFDGRQPAVIDVLKTGNCPALKEFLTDSRYIKIMFSCTNDLFMAQNVLGYTISPVRDIAIAQKHLGLKINLSDYIGLDKATKDSYQRANWLNRPLKEELIRYAIGDVTGLLDLEDRFMDELKEKNSLDKYLKESDRLKTLNYQVNQLEQYRNKFPGFRRLNKEQKAAARILWIFREFLGEYYDLPVGHLINKDSLRQCLSLKEDVLDLLDLQLNQRRGQGKKIPRNIIERIYRKALQTADGSFVQTVKPSE